MWILFHLGLLLGSQHNIVIRDLLIMVGVRIVSMRKHKKTKVLFSSHQCITVSQDKAQLLERCSLLLVCLYVCGCVCLSMCLSVCWTTVLLLSPSLSDH